MAAPKFLRRGVRRKTFAAAETGTMGGAPGQAPTGPTPGGARGGIRFLVLWFGIPLLLVILYELTRSR